ncbi:hypothetical protein QR680_016555 [Steinernema hermaphroditum]|uniref:Uncharacterized protein n=1 Tax=Steinernema hermaphroditum TaxID=289476 RepID=A0AA39HBJ7_9BILA|nr:hypothetical protein QR680_016555 [Steinernema hermaphroditum]
MDREDPTQDSIDDPAKLLKRVLVNGGNALKDDEIPKVDHLAPQGTEKSPGRSRSTESSSNGTDFSNSTITTQSEFTEEQQLKSFAEEEIIQVTEVKQEQKPPQAAEVQQKPKSPRPVEVPQKLKPTQDREAQQNQKSQHPKEVQQKQKSPQSNKTPTPEPPPVVADCPPEPKLSKEQYHKKPKKERFAELRNIRRALIRRFENKSAEPQAGKTPYGARGNKTRKSDVEEYAKKKQKEKSDMEESEKSEKSTRGQNKGQKLKQQMKRLKNSVLTRLKVRNTANSDAEKSISERKKKKGKSDDNGASSREGKTKK